VAELLTLRTAFVQILLPPLRAVGFWDYSDYYGGTHMGVVRASCVKPYPDHLMVAVQLIDCRADNQSLVCRVWVAPWDHADDGLERLQVGLCLIAFDAYDFSEAAAAGLAQRLLALDRLFPSLQAYVFAELAALPLQSYRAEVYKAERRLVEAVAGGRKASLTRAWEQVLAELAKLPDRRLSASLVQKRLGQFMREHRRALKGLAREVGLPYTLDGDMEGHPLDVEAFYTELVRRRLARRRGW
jgi:hypothetical protein